MQNTASDQKLAWNEATAVLETCVQYVRIGLIPKSCVTTIRGLRMRLLHHDNLIVIGYA